MRKAISWLNRLLHPPKWILCSLPPTAFAVLSFLFAADRTESVLAYPAYFASAYSLCILLAAAPAAEKRIKSGIIHSRTAQALASSGIGSRYLHDPAYRGSIGIYQGMAVNFFYVIFRIAAGVRYTSVWFISMAGYYLVLGGLRAYLIFSYRRRDTRDEAACYQRTAWLLFVLNIPMGAMIVQMVRTNSGFFYPGHIIYLSALYTFYTMAVSILNLVKFRKVGSPILSAAKVLNLISAMMSVLGLQTAMISRFSTDGEKYRQLMNALTGGAVYGAVVIIAVYMLLHGRKIREEADLRE